MSVIIDNRIHRTREVSVGIRYDIAQLDLSGNSIQVKFDARIVGGVGSKFTIRHSDDNNKEIGGYTSPVMESSIEGTSHVFTVDLTDELIQKAKSLTVITNGGRGTDKVDLEVTNVEIRTLEHIQVNADLFTLKTYQMVKDGGGGSEVAREFDHDEIINVEKYNSAILDLRFDHSDYHLEGSRNGLDYEQMQVIKIDSGTPYQRISLRGVYAVNLTGYKNVRLIEDYLGLNPQTFIITLSKESFINNIDTRPRTFYSPKKPKFEYTLNEIGDIIYLSGDKNGIVYGRISDEVFKSSDYGKNWESLGKPTTGARIDYVHKLDNGNVLAISINGTESKTMYFILDTNTGIWQTKYTHEHQGNFHPEFGFDAYDNVILYAPYQTPKITDAVQQVHYSNDYGETWKPIFDAPLDIEQWHFHDVAYDPYRDRIYLVNGDNIRGLNAGISWSADEGKTWNYAFDGVTHSQFTAILPTPTQIIFGTDEPRVRGAFRNPRGFDSPFVLDSAFHDMEAGGSNKNIVIGRGSHYWDTGNVVYFYGKNPAELYATKDGYNYFSMLKMGSDDTLGRLRNLSPLHDGKMAIGYSDTDGTRYVMVLENIEWEEI